MVLDKAMLKEITDLPGVSGNEDAVRGYILQKLKDLPVQTRVDRMGNVIATRKGNKRGAKKVLMTAHMDEIGLIVTGVNDNGLLSYQAVGGIDARVMVSKRVVVGKSAVPGVIGAKAIHLQSAQERQRMLKHDDLYIDIGAKDKAAAEKLAEPGDYVSLVSEYREFGEGLVKAKALDDRVGCLNMLRLLALETPCELTCAFTVQEEIGLFGARAVGFAHDHDCAVVLEGTAANDLGDVPGHLTVAKLGEGVAVSFMDRASIAHPALNQALTELGDKKKIPWQVKRFISGGNDAGALQTARGALACCVLSVPCRYIHSHASVASLRDIESQYQLAAEFLLSGAKF